MLRQKLPKWKFDNVPLVILKIMKIIGGKVYQNVTFSGLRGL